MRFADLEILAIDGGPLVVVLAALALGRVVEVPEADLDDNTQAAVIAGTVTHAPERLVAHGK